MPEKTITLRITHYQDEALLEIQNQLGATRADVLQQLLSRAIDESLLNYGWQLPQFSEQVGVS